MTIADIKAALAAKAAASNVKPALPVIEPPAHPEAPSAAVATEQQPLLAEQEQMKPKTRTRKTTAKPKTSAHPPVSQAATAPEASPMPEPPAPMPQQQPTKATSKKTVTRRSSSKKSEPDMAIVTEPIEAIIARHLKAGVDYSCIPGCGRKPALLKAGAEHLASIFKFRSTSSVTHRIEDISKGFLLYEVETSIIDREGNVVAVGLGSCNSRERRYQRDFAGSLNTVLKMAKKRSFVDAVLTATGASGVFTQDVDEIGRDLHEVSEQTAKEA